MTVYIVTAGEYSDYHIERVFLSYEKAEQYIALQNRNSEDYCYNEWNIESEEVFDECLIGETEVNYLYTFYYYEKFNKIKRDDPRIVGFKKKEIRKRSHSWVLEFTLDVEDDEKALKIAQDEFTKARALEF